MATYVSTQETTSLTSPPDVTQAYFSRKMLTRAKYRNYFDRWSEKTNLPSNEGKTIIMRRWAHLAMALSALSEGVPPGGNTPTLTDFQATLAQYGDFIAMSDFIRFTAKDPILNEWTDLLGEQAGYTIDAIKRNTADAGTTVIYSNGTARTDLVSPLDPNDLDRAIRTMMSAGGEMILGGSDGSTMQGTVPTLPAWPCVIHPRTLMTIQNFGGGANGFRYSSDYKGAADDEIGRYKMLAFFVAADPSTLGAGARVRTSGGGTSSLVTNTSGTADVYESLIFSKRGFNSVTLSGQSMKTFMKPVGSAGALDPLGQVGTVGWKCTTTQVRTNENWIVRLEHCVEL